MPKGQGNPLIKTATHRFSGFEPLTVAALVLLAGALLALGAVVMPAPAAAYGTGTISGKVTDEDNNPLSGVCVAAFDSEGSGASEHTDANGNYSLGFMETRDYRILFSRCGEDVNVFDEWYDDQATKEEANPVAATDGADTPGINAQLATAGSFSGKVTVEPNGPNQGTCVTALGGSGGWASQGRTDANGNYRVVGLESGQYQVKFSRCNESDNVISEFYPDKATRDDAAMVSVTAGSNTPGIDAELARGGSITGTYRIDAPVAPVACFGSASVYDSSGNQVGTKSFPAGVGVNDTYRFDRLRTGDYRVGFELGCGGESDPFLTFGSTDFYRGKSTLAEATPVHVTQGSTRTGINSLQGGGASISGTVTDQDGNPLSDICVDTFDDQGNLGNFGQTGPDGSYMLDQFTAGNYRLRFSDCLNPGSTIIPEFYDDKASLEASAPISLETYQAVTGIDAQMAVTEPDVIPPASAKLMVRVKGPFRVATGKRATYRVRIANAGKGSARGVKLRASGVGARFRAGLGRIRSGKSRTVKVKIKPKRSGKAKITFKVTSSNADAKTVKRRVKVR